MVGRPKSDNKKVKVLSVRLPNDLHEELVEYTKSNNETITNVAIEALRKHLSNTK